jgi:YidC/Oxa1 family membrane protein insertase
MKKKFLLFSLLATVIVIFFTGCATSPFPKVTESGVIVQTIARGRPMENITVGVKVTNNTLTYIGDVTVRLDSINGNSDLKPFELWNVPQEINIQSISKTSTIDSGKDATFTFPITSYAYIDSKSYPMVIKVSYKDSNGKENLITQNSIVDLVIPNKFYKFMRDIIEGIHKVIPNYGLAIVVLTIIIKLLTHPLTKAQFKSTAKMQTIQPEIKKIREKYKDNPQKQNQEVMRIYKENNISMFGGCLPLLVQWPLLFILFGALSNYAPFNTSRFLWLSNINTPDRYYVLPVLVFFSMFLQSKLSQLPGVEMDSNTRMMTYFLPVIFAVWAVRWAPSILLYWITFSLVQVVEQVIILRGLRVATERPMDQIPPRKRKGSPAQHESSQEEEAEIQEEPGQVTKEKEKNVKPTKKHPKSGKEKK